MACERVWEPEGVVAKYSGAVSGDDLLECVRRIQADARFDDTRYVIHDLSSIDQHAIGEATLTDLAVLHIGAAASLPQLPGRLRQRGQRAGGQHREDPDVAADEILRGQGAAPRCSLPATGSTSSPQLLRISDIMGFLSRPLSFLLPDFPFVARWRVVAAAAEGVDVRGRRAACSGRAPASAAGAQRRVISQKMRSTHCSWNSLWLRKETM